MKLKSKKILLVTLVFLLIAAVSAGCSKASKKPLVPTQRMAIGGFYVSNPSGSDDSFASLQRHSNVLDEVYPLWYHVKPDGSLQEEPNPDAIAFAKKNGIKIFPLINVTPSQDTVLRDIKARDNAIANIVRVVKQNNYDGVNIDFEFIPTTGQTDFSVDRDRLTEFMKILGGQMKKLGKETHMSVLPHVGVSKEMGGVYDYGSLAPYVKKVTIMTYDHSQAGSAPGPVAPFSWVEENIKTAIKQGFKPGQICLGVATYGYDWPAGKSGGFSRPSKDILEKAAVSGYQIKWSDKYQEPYYVYTAADGTQREVWFENEETLKTKLNLVNKYKLTGICIWRLGFEDQKFWSVIQQKVGKRK